MEVSSLPHDATRLFQPGLHLASAHLVAVADDPGALGRAFNVGGRELRTLCDVLRGQAAALQQMAKGRGE